MHCPFCREPDSKVVDSRVLEDGTGVRRRRECLACGERFTTYERAEEIPLYVVKKDGRREPFERTKLLTGLTRACEKRPIPRETIEHWADEISGILRDGMAREVRSSAVGELVMERLKAADPVAYLRFASVYREFRDLEAFLREIENLGQGAGG